MVASPGPANVLLFTLGIQQDIKRSIPFIASVILSKQIIIWPIGFGVMLIDEFSRQYYVLMSIISLLFILWIGYKIVLMDFSVNGNSNTWAPKFYHGLFVHPLNPKAWLMVSLAFTSYQKQEITIFTIPQIAITFFVIQMIFHSAWFLAGSFLRKSEIIESRKNLVKSILILSLIASIIFTYI